MIERLDNTERTRMAEEREETLKNERNLSRREREELISEVDMLLNFHIVVGFDGNDVVRM